MKTAIVYYSCHHGNTKKVLDAIAAEGNVDLLDVKTAGSTKLSDYDLIGFASGIYYWKMQAGLVRFVEENLPEGKKVFFLYTCGAKRKGYTDQLTDAARLKGCEVAGEYGCLGFDTFGPFKLIGGIAKGHPQRRRAAGRGAFLSENFGIIGILKRRAAKQLLVDHFPSRLG